MARSIRTIGAFEAKNRLSELLRQTEQGHSFAITRRGREVGRLVPPAGETAGPDMGRLRRSFEELRRRVSGSVDVVELVREGRRR